MAVQLNCYLNFNGNAAKAIEFYKSVFGGKIEMSTFREFLKSAPDSGMEVGEADMDKVMHASLAGDNGIEIMVSDVPTGMPPVKSGGQVTLCLSGDDEATLRGYWDKLSQGGSVDMPLAKAPWGDQFGVLTDKFDISWMVNVNAAQS